MQAVVVAGLILEQQRRRPGLACRMAALQECVVSFGIADADAHCFVPTIGHIAKSHIERRAQPYASSSRLASVQSIASARAAISDVGSGWAMFAAVDFMPAIFANPGAPRHPISARTAWPGTARYPSTGSAITS